jgi:hypothetical protein
MTLLKPRRNKKRSAIEQANRHLNLIIGNCRKHVQRTKETRKQKYRIGLASHYILTCQHQICLDTIREMGVPVGKGTDAPEISLGGEGFIFCLVFSFLCMIALFISEICVMPGI